MDCPVASFLASAHGIVFSRTAYSRLVAAYWKRSGEPQATPSSRDPTHLRSAQRL